MLAASLLLPAAPVDNKAASDHTENTGITLLTRFLGIPLAAKSNWELVNTS